jgi:hypothetical protein
MKELISFTNALFGDRNPFLGLDDVTEELASVAVRFVNRSTGLEGGFSDSPRRRSGFQPR